MYVERSAYICYLQRVQDHNSFLFSITSLQRAPPGPRNNHSNVKQQFLSLRRLPQLAKPSRLTVVLVSLMSAEPAVILWL